MVLGSGIVDATGARHAMAGLLSLETSFAARRLNLGYRRARLLADSSLGRANDIVLGHEFHYASTLAMGDAPLVACSDASGTTLDECGARRGSVSGTFFHAIDSEKLRP
jgi:cobyrinic acid a,c-diamide synthase